MSLREEMLQLAEAAEDDEGRERALRLIARKDANLAELRRTVKALTKRVEGLSIELEAAVGSVCSKPLRIPKPKRKGSAPIMPWAGLSDQHLEERVPLEQTAGLNEHGVEESGRRHDRWTQQAAGLYKERERIQRVESVGLWLGGDHITGHIHRDLVDVAELPPQKAGEVMYQRLQASIKYLLDELKCERMFVVTNWGNHGRTETGRPRVATAHDYNVEQTIFRALAAYFEDDDRVSFDVSETAVKYLEVPLVDKDRPPFTMRFNHGDMFQYNSGARGMQVPIFNLLGRLNQERVADLNIFGHYHVLQWLKDVRTLVNGSTIGHSEYSRRFGFQRPEQLFWWLDLDRGSVGGVLPVWVTD